MSVTDTYLTSAAKAMAGTTFTYPAYLLVSTSTAVTAVASTATSIAGEIGTRQALTTVRTGKEIVYSAIRTPGNVITTSTGDSLTVAGLSSSSSNVDVHMGQVIASLTHTTNFNIEWDFQVLFDTQ